MLTSSHAAQHSPSVSTWSTSARLFTLTAGPKHPEKCNGSADWSWAIGNGADSRHGCTHDSTTCVIKAVTATNGFSAVCLDGGSGFGPWNSCQFFAVVGKGDAVLSGFVTDRDHDPVSGTTVAAEGPGGGRAETGDDGYYAIVVKPGTYQVTASGGPSGKKEASYAPARRSVSVPADGKARNPLELRAGLEVQLKFSEDEAPATGFAVVKGTIITTEYGKPLPSETVHLNAMPGKSDLASVRDAPMAAVCGPSRIWPQGTLADPDATSVNITTDAHGRYEFTVAVGASPGKWKLEATAEVTGADGPEISTDPDASDTESIDIRSVGSLRLAGSRMSST